MALNELEIEISNWLQKLENMQHENVDMKTRLADVVKQTITPATLDKAEQFQSHFLNKDTVISFMRADIKEHLQKLKIYSKNTFDIISRQNKLRRDMERMETEFNNMKASFATYLLQLA